MKRLSLLAGCLLVLAGCGGTSTPKLLTAPHPTTTTTTPGMTPASQCPPGQSSMGCAEPAPPKSLSLAPRTMRAVGARFPDVSSYQGHPNWTAAKASGIAGAVAKASEYSQDPSFTYNVQAFKRLGIPWAGYDFVRSCNASTFIAVLKSVGGPTSLPPVLDMEVPSAAGCAPQLETQVYRAFHRTAVIYTGPGTWGGGSHAGLPLWEATYGPSFSPVWQPVVAWQYTDAGYIPGIGTGDVSVDYGFTRMLPVPVKPKPTRAQSARWTRARNAAQGAYVAKGCPRVVRNEHWFGARLHGKLAAKHRRAFLASQHVYAKRCARFAQESVYFSRRLAGK